MGSGPTFSRVGWVSNPPYAQVSHAVEELLARDLAIGRVVDDDLTACARWPVKELDGKPIGTGERPVTARIRQLYKDLVAAHVAERKA